MKKFNRKLILGIGLLIVSHLSSAATIESCNEAANKSPATTKDGVHFNTYSVSGANNMYCNLSAGQYGNFGCTPEQCSTLQLCVYSKGVKSVRFTCKVTPPPQRPHGPQHP